jgi:hypothetical protein
VDGQATGVDLLRQPNGGDEIGTGIGEVPPACCDGKEISHGETFEKILRGKLVIQASFQKKALSGDERVVVSGKQTDLLMGIPYVGQDREDSRGADATIGGCGGGLLEVLQEGSDGGIAPGAMP